MQAKKEAMMSGDLATEMRRYLERRREQIETEKKPFIQRLLELNANLDELVRLEVELDERAPVPPFPGAMPLG